MAIKKRYLDPLVSLDNENDQRIWLEDLSRKVNLLLNPGWNDYLISSTAVGTNASLNPPSIAQVGASVFYLPQYQKDDQGWFTLHLLHDFKADQLPTFHVHWTHDQGTPTGNLVWKIDYTVVRGYNAAAYNFASPTTLSTTVDASTVPQYYHHVAGELPEPSDMKLSASDDLVVDAVIIGRIYRGNAGDGDTFNDDPFLLQVDMHYEMAQLGTQKRNTFLEEGFTS